MIYKYLFYWFYNFSKKYKLPQLPEGVAFFSITMLMIVNILTVFDVLVLIKNKSIFVNPIYYLVFVLLVFTVNYFIFLHNDKYTKIIKKIAEKKTIKNNKTVGLIVVSYVLLSIFLLVKVGILVVANKLLEI